MSEEPVIKYRGHIEYFRRHGRKGVGCNTTVGRLSLYIRGEWHKQNSASTEEEIDEVATDTDKEISRVKDFLALRTKSFVDSSASSEIDFEYAPKPKRTHELPVSRVDRN